MYMQAIVGSPLLCMRRVSCKSNIAGLGIMFIYSIIILGMHVTLTDLAECMLLSMSACHVACSIIIFLHSYSSYRRMYRLYE